jgi:hypothetical protein
LIPAIGDQYLACAQRLAASIRQWHPDANIAVMTVTRCDDPVFDHVVPLPFGDQEGWANDWQVFHASPYRQTIKLEADMIAASPVDHWWTLFEHRDVVVSQGCRDFYDRSATSRFYRRFIDENGLPDVFNAITYWRLSETAQRFFALVRHIFEHWAEFRRLVKFAEPTPSTDFVYAMAAEITGRDLVTLPVGLGPQIVHMKKHIVNIHGQDWTRELIWETDPLRINTVAQNGFVHYHIKDWIGVE